jgi:hypothetical protein
VWKVRVLGGTGLSKRDSALVRGGPSNAMMIMTIIHIPLVMSDGHEMDSSSRAPAARRAWVHVAMSCRAMHQMSPLPEAPMLVEPILVLKAPG